MISIKLAFVITFVILNSSQSFPMANSLRAEEISHLVQDVIHNERVPSILWAKTCWSKIDDFTFAKSAPFFVQMVKSNPRIQLSIDESKNKQWFFIDMKCSGAVTFLSNVNDTYFAHSYRWIIADATDDSIQHLKFLPDSNVILANKDRNSDDYILKQGMKFKFQLYWKNTFKIAINTDQNFINIIICCQKCIRLPRQSR